MTNGPLPDDYLSIPVFREHTRGVEVDALFSALLGSMAKLVALLHLHDYLDESSDSLFREEDDDGFDFTYQRVALYDQDLPGLEDDAHLHFLDDQIDAMRVHAQLIGDYGFPDMITAALEIKQLRCVRLSQMLQTLVKQGDLSFYKVPYAMLNLYFRWQFHRPLLLSIVRSLADAAKPYRDLDLDHRYDRLCGMLSLTDMSTDLIALERDLDRLRVTSQLLYQDDGLPHYHRQLIGGRLLNQVEQSTMLKLISRYEFSTLLLLLLSKSISPRVKSDTQQLLSKRLRVTNLPISTKMDFYHCFVEVIMAHSNCVCLESIFLMMCDEIEYDQQVLFKNHLQRSLLDPIQSILSCLYEYSLYVALSGEARMHVCEKLLTRLCPLLAESMAHSFLLIAHKLRILLKFDHSLQKRDHPLKQTRYRLFTVSSNPQYDDRLYVRCTTLIWQSPIDIDFCEQCVNWMDDFCPDASDPDYYLQQFIDRFGASNVVSKSPQHSP